MIKRQRRTIGSVLEIDLGNGFYNYAQIGIADIMFYNIYSKGKLKDITILQEKEPLFFLSIYDYVITKGEWLKVGKLPIKDEHKVVPYKFMQDALNPNRFDLYNPNTGEITVTTKEQCEGLERSSVWEAEHVKSRIIDHFEGRPNIWVEQLSIK